MDHSGLEIHELQQEFSKALSLRNSAPTEVNGLGELPSISRSEVRSTLSNFKKSTKLSLSSNKYIWPDY